MARRNVQMTTGAQRGFSLMEMLVSLAILSLVLGVVMQGVVTMQSRNDVETNKVDLTQQSREFMDQIVNDLRQSGFPRPGMFDPTALIPPASAAVPPNCTVYSGLACGLLYLDATQVQFEGDVDGTGVSMEWIKLVQTNGANAPACTTPPCVLQRGTISKASWMLGNPISYYTEVNGVMNTNVFTAYDNNGLDLSASLPIANAYAQGYNNGLNIRAIGITLYLRASQIDAKTHTYPTVTMVSTARVND